MSYAASLRGERFVFADLREVFARASEEKSGDRLAGVAARSARERVAAKRVLADVTLSEIVERPLVDPDDDAVMTHGYVTHAIADVELGLRHGARTFPK